MVYDCFTFFNELDLLEIRLNTLNDVVDRFVIAEATRTHRGRPKELIFEQNRARYAAFAEKITYIVVEDLLPEEEVEKDAFNFAWVNENRQRNALRCGLADAADGDVVMISDLDEIPRPQRVCEAVKLASKGEIVRLRLDMYYYYANFKDYYNPYWLLGTMMLSMATFRTSQAFDDFVCDRFTVTSENCGHTVQKVRFLKPSIILKQGGWHMSYLGGEKAILEKLSSFSHAEAAVVVPLVAKRLHAGENVFGGCRTQFGIPIDGSFPKYLVENQARFRHLIFDVDDDYLKRTHLLRLWVGLASVGRRCILAVLPQSFVGFLSRFWMRIRFR